MHEDSLPGNKIAALGDGEVVTVRALLLGERLDTRKFEEQRLTPTGPTAMRVANGCAVLFRYGAVVMFGLDVGDEKSLIETLLALISEPYDAPDREVSDVVIRTDIEERVDAAGTIYVKDRKVERLQIIAHILAKSLVLAHHETRVAVVFDRIDPLAAAMETSGRIGAHGKELIRQIGNVLRVQHRMVGRVETGEKPDLLWDHPELDRLYARLAEEYELKERDQGLDRKLELISRTVVTLQSLLQSRSSHRLEWYVVLLIVAEIAISIYSMVLR